MTTVCVREVSSPLVAAMNAAARAEGLSREQLLRRLIEREYGESDPPLLIGFVYIDIPGEAENCAECGQPLNGNSWIAVHDNGDIFGPVCAGCAAT